MKGVTILLIFLISACSDKSIEELAIQAARKSIDAVKHNDWEKAVGYTCPLKIKESGGRDKMIERLKGVSKGINTIAEIELGDVEEIQIINGTTYARFFYYVLDRSAKNKFRVDMIGVSTDQGKTWWFIDGPLNIKQFEKYLPDLVGKMEVPAMQRPLPKTK